MTPEYYILIVGYIFGFYMAWNIGANDVANAMGTSVGSGAITVKQAVIIAAIFEFAGAFIAGGSVTKTIRKGIIDPSQIVGSPEILVFGMLAALLAAAIWLMIASANGWPVSTTHSIIGGLGSATAEAMAPCVLWVEEIEKGVATGDYDSGTSQRLLGSLLTWMAERRAPVFMVAKIGRASCRERV